MPRNKILYLFMQNKVSIIFINWLFQGIFGLSKIDLVGKIIIEILIILIVNVAAGEITFAGVIISILIAHTFNWIFNTHFWVLGRFVGITKTPTHRFYSYLKKMQKRISNANGLIGVIVIGGASRGEKIRNTSDLDIFLFSQPQLNSKVKAVLFTIKERIIAFLWRFPLDLYLYENLVEMSKHRKDEVPFVLYDTKNIVRAYYEKQDRKIAHLKDFPRK